MKKQIIPIAVVAVVLIAGLALWLGLRESPEAAPDQMARGITILAPQDTELFVVNTDEESEIGTENLTLSSSETHTLELAPGNYTIFANRGEQYFPWKKDVVVTEETSTEFYPIFFPQDPDLELVDAEHADFEKATEAFSVPATLPTSEEPKENADSTAELYLDGGTIFIGWMGELALAPEFLCPGENTEECRLQPIFSFDGGVVENVEFFGERDEILILDLGSDIVALEVDRRDINNRQPLYVGTNSAFRIIDGDIYVSDNGVVSRINLD